MSNLNLLIACFVLNEISALVYKHIGCRSVKISWVFEVYLVFISNPIFGAIVAESEKVYT